MVILALFLQDQDTQKGTNMSRKYTVRNVGDFTTAQRLNALQAVARRATLHKDVATAFENARLRHPVLAKMSVSEAVNSVVVDWVSSHCREGGSHA